MRRDMIERAEAMRTRLVAKLGRSDLRPNARQAAFGRLRMVEERLLNLREGE